MASDQERSRRVRFTYEPNSDGGWNVIDNTYPPRRILSRSNEVDAIRHCRRLNLLVQGKREAKWASR